MSTIKLRVIVSNLDDVLELYDRIKVYRSTTGQTGNYVEITTQQTRIPILADETVYEYDDTNGDPAYYYKTSYYNSTTAAESDFSQAVKGQGTGNYVSIQDMREEGITETQCSDTRMLALIQLYEQYVEQNTGQWFYPRDMTLELDGSGSYLLQLPVPIIRVDEVKVNGGTTALDSSQYFVYDRMIPDDRQNPRIKLKSMGSDITNFYGMLNSSVSTAIFERGERNQSIKGVFGYVEEDGTAPLLIKYAVRKLISLNLTKLGVGGASMTAGPVTVEVTDKHRIQYSEKTLTSATISNDPEIDLILARYRRPTIIDAPYGEII